jgi:hypothetical protein
MMVLGSTRRSQSARVTSLLHFEIRSRKCKRLLTAGSLVRIRPGEAMLEPADHDALKLTMTSRTRWLRGTRLRASRLPTND